MINAKEDPDVTGDKWRSPQWSFGEYGRSPGQRAAASLLTRGMLFFAFSGNTKEVIKLVE